MTMPTEIAARTTAIAIAIGSVEEEPSSLFTVLGVEIGLAVDSPAVDGGLFEPLSGLLCGLPPPSPLLGVPPEPEEFSVSEVSSGVAASEPGFGVLAVEGVDGCLFVDELAGGLDFGGYAEGGVSEYWISPESA
jgi:hypothetical protein